MEAPIQAYDWDKLNLPVYQIGDESHSATVLVIRRDGRLVPTIILGVGFPHSLNRYFHIGENVRPRDDLMDSKFVDELTTNELIESIKAVKHGRRVFMENALRLAVLAQKPLRRRPKKLDDKTLGRIKYWTKRGLNKSDICRKVNISRPTLYTAYKIIREKDAERLIAAYKAGQVVGGSLLQEVIYNRAWHHAKGLCLRVIPDFEEKLEYGAQYFDFELFRKVFFTKVRELRNTTTTNMLGFII